MQGNLPTGGGGGGFGDWLKGLLPIIGSVAGAVIDKQSQDASNKANAQNVDKQLAFQREQGATQYQRATQDMLAAGLNPALAYKQGGNQTQSGAAAENKAVMHAQRFQQAVDVYQQFANGSAQRQLIREQAAATAAETRKKWMEGTIMSLDAELAIDNGGEVNGEKVDGYRQLYRKGKLAEIRGKKFLSDKTEERYGVETAATRQATATARQQEKLMGTAATLNEQQFQNEWFRKNVAPYLNSTAKVMEGLGGVARTGKGLTGYTPHNRYY